MRIALVTLAFLTTVSCVRAGQVCAEGTFQCRFNNVEECIDDFWVVVEECSDAQDCGIVERVGVCENP